MEKKIKNYFRIIKNVQFIDLLPAGSLLSVVTAGFRAREVNHENKLFAGKQAYNTCVAEN